MTPQKEYKWFLRKQMRMEMQRMEDEDWYPKNRREPRDGYDISSWIVGIVGGLFILGAVIAQVAIHFHGLKP